MPTYPLDPSLSSAEFMRSMDQRVTSLETAPAPGEVTTGLDANTFDGFDSSDFDFKRSRGAWAASTAYLLDDVVLYRGFVYRATTAHTSTTVFNTANFVKVTAQGGPPPQPGSLKIVGHSYLDATGIGVTKLRGTSFRIAKAFGMLPPQVQNIAISGGDVRHHLGSCTYATVLQKINPGVRPAPRAADAGVVYAMWGTNDAVQGGTAGTWTQYSFQNAYIASICRYRAASVYENTDTDTVSYSGTWTEVLYSAEDKPSGSGVSYHKTNTAASKVIITTPTDMGRYNTGVWVNLGFICENTGATAEVWLDGVKHGDLNVGFGTATGTKITNFPADWKSGYVYRMWVPTSTTDPTGKTVSPHTIEVRFGAAVSSGFLKFDYWQIEADFPPLILVSNLIQPSNPTYVWIGLAVPALHDLYNVWIANVVATFASPLVRVVDSDTPMGGTTGVWSQYSNQHLFSSDGLHPNPEGAKVIAEAAYEEYIAALSMGVDGRSLLGYWAEEVESIYAPPEWVTGTDEPLGVLDGFDRDPDNSQAIGGSGWTAQLGGWATVHSQAYLQEAKFTNAVFTDDFTRANSTSVVGDGWTSLQGTIGINTNSFYISTNGAGNKSLAVREAGSTTQWVEVIFEASSATYDMGLFFRVVDVNNWLAVIPNRFVGGWHFYKCVAGTVTRINGAPYTDFLTGAPNYGLHVEVGTDDVVRVYGINKGGVFATWGALSVNTYTITDAALQTGGSGTKVGLGSAASSIPTTSRLRNFRYGTTINANSSGFVAPYSIITQDTGWANGVVGFQIGDSGLGHVSNFQGLVFRYQDPDTWYGFYASYSYGPWSFVKCVAGVVTVLELMNGTNTPGTEIAVVMAGSSFSFYYNGTLMETKVDTTYATGNKHGLMLVNQWYQTANDARWADFRTGKTLVDLGYGAMYLKTGDATERILYGPKQSDGSWGATINLTPTKIDGGSL